MISHDPDQAAPRAADVHAVSAAPLAFQAPTAFGPVGLSLPRAPDASGPITGAEQVLRLAQAEPLISAVEHWLHGPWDPAPCRSPGDREAGYRATVRDPALAPPGATLHVPLQALLTPPPDGLRAPALTWAAHDAVVVLGEVPLDAAEQLEEGGLLWLPASFSTAWAVRLVDAAHRLPPCPARLDLSAQRLTVTPHHPDLHASRRGAAAPDALQVVLSAPLQVPLDHWLGWGRAGVPFHWPVPQPWAAELQQGLAVLARGALLPMGAGCGLRIDALTHPVPTG